jgi:hypothetical protein
MLMCSLTVTLSRLNLRILTAIPACGRKSIHKVLKTLQDHVKSKFDIIHSDVHGSLAILFAWWKKIFCHDHRQI